MNMTRVIAFVVTYVVWCVLCWVPSVQQLVAGAVVSGLLAWFTGDLLVERPGVLRHAGRYVQFLFVYIPVFLWECFKANIDVARRVADPRLPIHPGIVRVRTELQSDAAVTFLANSITLTPGTMTVDVDRDHGILYVHWIDVKAADTAEATRLISARFERILKKVFE